MATVQTLGDSEDRCEGAYGPAQRRRKLRVLRMRPFRGATAVIPRDQRHHFDLIWMKAAQIAVLDQVVGMIVMAGKADVATDVVHQRGIFEPFALAVGEPMDRSRLIEERKREPYDLIRVIGVVAAALGEFERAPAPHVRNAVDLRDLASVPTNIIEHQPFTKRQVTQRQFLRAEAAENRVEQH